MKFVYALVLLMMTFSASAAEQSAKALTITQSWSKDGIYATTGLISTIATVNGALSNEAESQIDVSVLVNSQRKNFNGMSDSTIRNEFSTYARGFFNSISASVKQLMRESDVQAATFNLEQQFQQGAILKRVINTTLVKITGNGQLQITRLGTTIIRDPIILKATYVSKKVSAEVPVEFAYANSGKIVYRLFDKHDNPLTAELTVDVNGAYDQLDDRDVTPSDRLINSSWMPQCLMSGEWADYVHGQEGVTLDGTTAFKCPTAAQGATTDLKKLADQHDATDIILDYAQKLSVIYDPVDPSCTAEDCQQLARVQVNVESRVLTNKKYLFFIAPYGKPTFTVSGNIGFGLMSDVIQYHAKTEDISLFKDTSNGAILGAGGGLLILDNVMTELNSPNKDFSKTIELTENGSRSFYQNLVINPFVHPDPNIDLKLYDWRNDTVNGLPAERYCYAGVCNRVAPIVGGIN